MNKREQKGITLIALVITIIVLLILAGVTIFTISANENIMDKANEAREKTNMSNEKESIQVAAIGSLVGKNNGLKIDKTTLDNNLNGIIERKIEPTNEEETTTEICVQGKTGEKYIIDENGKVMTIYEKAKLYTNFNISNPSAIINPANQAHYVHVMYGVSTSSEDYKLKNYGIIYNNDGSIHDTNKLKLENIDNNTIIHKSGKTGTNLLDKENGVIAVGYATVTDKYGNDIVIYTGDIGGNYDELDNN